jgi:hypothetical protein
MKRTLPISLTALAFTLTAPASANTLTSSSVSTCNDARIEVHTASAGGAATGTIVAHHRGRSIALDEAESAIFQRLSQVSSVNVTCGDARSATQILIQGKSREEGARSVTYRITFRASSGFGAIKRIN